VKTVTNQKTQTAGFFPDWKLAYRIPEACAAIGFKRSKLYELIKAGRLAVRKEGSCTVILRAELERYLNSLPSVVRV
jgi:excisionase family DNA binding protein